MQPEKGIPLLFRESFQKQFHIFSDSNLFLYKENIYGAMWEEPVIYRFDVKRKKISFIQLPDSKDGFVQMAGRDGKLFYDCLPIHFLKVSPCTLPYHIAENMIRCPEQKTPFIDGWMQSLPVFTK